MHLGIRIKLNWEEILHIERKCGRVPENVTELRQLLCLINYYGTFLNQLSTTLAPLHSLLRADAEWKCTTDCDAAVTTVKEQLTGDQVLIHYDPNKPLVLSTDASA